MGFTKLEQNWRRSGLKFELRDPNRKSASVVEIQIEFWFQLPRPIFEYPVFEKKYLKSLCFCQRSRARGRQQGSRRGARRGRVRARYAGSRVWQALVLASAPRGRLASSGDRGSISVVLRIILNNYNRQVGARRRLEKIQFCETQGWILEYEKQLEAWLEAWLEAA